MQSGLFSVDDGITQSESKEMELARMRNLSMQRRLDKRLSEIQHDWDAHISRITIEQRYIQRMLDDMRAAQRGGQGRLILPRGLSPRHVQMIKDKREQENTKSISLQEFDKKMDKLRNQRTVFRSVLLNYRAMHKKGKFAPPPELEEQCTHTNIHFDLYRNTDKDAKLKRELSNLRRIQLPKPPVPAIYRGTAFAVGADATNHIESDTAGDKTSQEISEDQTKSLPPLVSNPDNDEDCKVRRDSKDIVRHHSHNASSFAHHSSDSLPVIKIPDSPQDEDYGWVEIDLDGDLVSKEDIDMAIHFPGLSPGSSRGVDYGEGGSPRHTGSSGTPQGASSPRRAQQVSKYHAYRSSGPRMPKAGKAQGLGRPNLSRGNTFS